MKVPSYNNFQVAPQQLPNGFQETPRGLAEGNLYAARGMANLGEAVTNSGSMLGKVALEQQIDINEAAVKGQHAKLLTSVSDILHAPNTGYINQVGKNAIDGFDAAHEALTKLPDSMGDELTNDAQKRMFKQQALMTVTSAISQAQQHAGIQTQKYELDSSQSRAASSADMAVKSYNPMPNADNSIYQQNLDTQRVELESQADRLGITGKERENFIQYGHDGRSGMAATYASVVSHLVENKQTPAAKEYFKKVEKEMPTAVRDKLNEILTVGQTKEDGLSLAIDVKHKINGIAAQEKHLDDLFTKGKISSDVHEIALGKLRSDHSQNQALQGEADKSILGQIWDMKKKNPNMSLADLSPSQMNYIKSRGLGSHVDEIIGHDPVAKSDPVAYFNITAHLGDGSDKDVTKMSDAEFFQLRSKLSSNDFESFTKERAHLINGSGAAKNDPASLNTQIFTSSLNQRLKQVGIVATPTSNPDAKARVGAAQQFATEWVLSEQQAAGHRFKQEEVMKSLDKLFATNVEFRNSLWGTKSSSKLINMTAKDIPSAAYDGIKQDLINGGNEAPSDSDILMQYWRLHGKH